MAFGRISSGSGAGGGRSTGSGGQRPLSDINVTPLVDVMLVLVVIFIVTAPLMASSIRLDLPRTDGGKSAEVPKFVRVSLDAEGRVFVDDQPLDEAALAARLAQVAAENRDTEIQLRADRTVPYGRVVELMGVANKAGLNRIGFVTEAPSPR